MMYINVYDKNDLFDAVENILKEKEKNNKTVKIKLDFVKDLSDIDDVLDILEQIAKKYNKKIETEYNEYCCSIYFDHCYLLFFNLADPPYISIVNK